MILPKEIFIFQKIGPTHTMAYKPQALKIIDDHWKECWLQAKNLEQNDQLYCCLGLLNQVKLSSLKSNFLQLNIFIRNFSTTIFFCPGDEHWKKCWPQDKNLEQNYQLYCPLGLPNRLN